MASRKKVVIMGAAGTDFHTFNMVFRDNEAFKVVAFTATQIPDIAGRKYPPVLAGKLYPEGIPIMEEKKLPEIIKRYEVDLVVFAYHDVSYDYLMHRASIANACGADFILVGTNQRMIKSSKPVIAVCAVRTGSGKSQTSRKITKLMKTRGHKIVAIRHPMPYGDLSEQVWQRFATPEDIEKHDCTIEEREEYEPYIENGLVVFAGVDYQKILEEAEKEADVILWDGGNNDYSFYKPDLYITVADPHRPGHEILYYAGEINARIADVVIINKVGTAKPDNVALVEKNIKKINPDARIIKANSPMDMDRPEEIRGKRVLVVEDGPTLTHGGLSVGAGFYAAQKAGVAEIIDPRPYAYGSIKEVFEKYHHITQILPAMGYTDEQIEDLEKTINAAECDVVVDGSPVNLNNLIEANKPIVEVRYTLDEIGPLNLEVLLDEFEEKFMKK
jgi:predicted GTPase